ncbi:MAG: hypothetical protein ACI8RD_000993 [Bacillariaceae sp.]|jgi:hypothetical protein
MERYYFIPLFRPLYIAYCIVYILYISISIYYILYTSLGGGVVVGS